MAFRSILEKRFLAMIHSFLNKKNAAAVAAALSFAGVLGSDGARADSPPSSTTGWTIAFTSYSWLSWLDGQGGVAGRKFDVDVDPIQLIEHLDWDQIPVWMSYFEARNGRFSIFNDIVYSKLEGSADFAVSRTRRFSGLSLSGDIEAEVEQATVELGAAYAIAQWGQAGIGGFTAFDVLGGGRYWHQEVDLSVDATLNVNLLGLTLSGSRAFAKSGSVDWIDPFVGGRLRHTLAPGQELMVRGDVGGFGAGSDFTWHAIATYNWHICQFAGMEIDGYAGYRALSVDYEQGSGVKEYEYDVIQHGPVFGMTSRF